jgi:hypothetical protein
MNGRVALILSVLALLAAVPGTLRAEEPLIVTTYPSLSGERIYIVEEGDTLWDISEQFFEDPHYWPVMWAFNPQITNPHWIYPGDYVVIFPKNLTEQGAVLVWANSRYNDKAKDISLEVRSLGFISDRDFRESGKIVWSREERDMLGQYDEIYVEFYIPKKIMQGEEFTVYRKEGKVEHPVTGDLLGWKVRHLGKARVLGVEKAYAKALLLTTYQEIGRGDMFTDIFNHQTRLSPTANKVDLEASIVLSMEDDHELGESSYVFLDKGRNDGVQEGNRFVVLERGDGRYELDDDDLADLPWEVVGEIMIVEPYDGTSLGVITRSIKELSIGQRCEMRKGYGEEPQTEQ